jgi:hypothetical protein
MATESSSTAGAGSLYSRYPITSSWELTLNDGEVVKGQVYCTDPTASIVVLQDPTVNDIRMVSVASIQESKRIQEATKSQIDVAATEISHTKKALEEREKRAIKLAQESLRHLNPKVSNPCTTRNLLVLLSLFQMEESSGFPSLTLVIFSL